MSSRKAIKEKIPISIEKFVSILKHKPKWVGNEMGGMIIVQFRDFDEFSPSLEFNVKLEDNGVQGIYFEILDLHGYKDGDFIQIKSKRRKCVMRVGMTYDKKVFDYAREIGYKDVFFTPEDVARRIDESLTLLYSGKLRKKKFSKTTKTTKPRK